MRKATAKEVNKAITPRYSWAKEIREGKASLPVVLTVGEDCTTMQAARVTASHNGWRANKLSDTELLISVKEDQ